MPPTPPAVRSRNEDFAAAADCSIWSLASSLIWVVDGRASLDVGIEGAIVGVGVGEERGGVRGGKDSARGGLVWMLVLVGVLVLFDGLNLRREEP